MRNKTKITLTLLILLGFVALNTFAQDEPYLVIGDGHTRGVNSVAFSPDGNTIASASADNTIKLWDIKTGVLLKTLTGHTDGVYSVAYSPDGNTLAGVSGDFWEKDHNRIELWDARTGENINMLTGHTDSVNILAFSPNGNILASASSLSMLSFRI